MPSKQHAYRQWLVDQYKTVDDAIKVYENILVDRLATNEEQQAYQQNLQKREKLLQSMGVEFPSVWESLLRLKSQ